MVRAGLQAIYLSGWQVAADANLAGDIYPDQSLYPANSVPAVVRRLNNALLRADQIDWSEGRDDTYWLAPIVADAEAGFGGALNAYELMKAMIEAGAGGVHFEDQLAAEKKCGHLGGKVLVPTSQFIRTLTRGAARGRRPRRPDRPDRPHRRAQRDAAHERHRPDRRRVPDRRAHRRGLLHRPRRARAGDRARSLAYAPYADVLWFETSTPGPRGGTRVRRRDPRAVPGQAPRLQLLAVVQLEEPAERRADRELPARPRRARLSLPVHHARRVPRAQPVDVRARAPLPRRRHDRVRGACRSASSSSRPRATRRPGTSARSAPATST